MLIDLGGRKIYYDLTGPAGAPVVCMAHSLTSDSGMWAEQLPALLDAGYRVLRLDMRGHGGSDAVSPVCTMEELADDVAASLDFLGLAKVQFVGLSIGGMLGQAFAIKYPGRMISAMFCDTAPKTPAGSHGIWRSRIEAVKEAGTVSPLADATMERWFTDAFRPRNPERWKQIHATICETAPAGYLGGAAAILDFDFEPALSSVQVPTLVVCGADDEGTPPAGNKRVAELIPGGRYEEIENARHFPNVERPETFNRIMLGWLKQSL